MTATPPVLGLPFSQDFLIIENAIGRDFCGVGPFTTPIVLGKDEVTGGLGREIFNLEKVQVQTARRRRSAMPLATSQLLINAPFLCSQPSIFRAP